MLESQFQDLQVRASSISRPSVWSISLGCYLHLFCIYARFRLHMITSHDLRLTSPSCCPAASLPIPGSSWSLRQGGRSYELLDAKWWCQFDWSMYRCCNRPWVPTLKWKGMLHMFAMIEPNPGMGTTGPPLRMSPNKRWIQMAILTHATHE